MLACFIVCNRLSCLQVEIFKRCLYLSIYRHLKGYRCVGSE